MLGGADVESANYSIDACGCDGGTAVFVPIVGEAFGGREAWGLGAGTERWSLTVDGDEVDEVVRGRRRGAKVEDADMRIRAHRGDD